MSFSKKVEGKYGENEDGDDSSHISRLPPSRNSIPGENIDPTTTTKNSENESESSSFKFEDEEKKLSSLSTKRDSKRAAIATKSEYKTYTSSTTKNNGVTTMKSEDRKPTDKPVVPKRPGSAVPSEPEFIPETVGNYDGDLIHQKLQSKISYPSSNTNKGTNVKKLPGAVAVKDSAAITTNSTRNVAAAASANDEPELIYDTQTTKYHDNGDLTSKLGKTCKSHAAALVATAPGAVAVGGDSSKASAAKTASKKLANDDYDHTIKHKEKYYGEGQAASKDLGLIVIDTEEDEVDVENCQAPGSHRRPGAFSIEGVGGNVVDEANSFGSVEQQEIENTSPVVHERSTPSAPVINERSSSMHLISATMVEDPEIWEAEAVSESEVKRKRRRFFFCIMGGFLVVNAIVLGSVLPKVLNKNPAPSPTPSPTPFPTISPSASPSAVPTTNIRARLESLIPTQTIDNFDDENSPQHQALLWIEGDNNTDIFNVSDGRLTQRFALATLFYSTLGNNWIGGTNWLSSTDECGWQTSLTPTLTEQLTTDRTTPCYGLDDELFTSLELTFHRMSGSLPPELSLLSALEKIDLSNNILTGAIPSELGLLNRMTELILNENSISGSIPSEIGHLTNVRTLDLSSNNLQGTIPSTLMQSVLNLKILNLFDNNLSGQIMSDIGMLKQLETVSLARNTLSGPIPSELGQLELRGLLLDGNALSGTIPFGNSTEIPPLFGTVRNLGISGNFLSGYIPTEIGLMSQIRFLHLQRNQLSGPIPTELGIVKGSLKELMLGNNKLTMHLPQEFWQLTNLNTMDLSYNPLLVGSISENLDKMTNLNKFELIYTGLTGTIPTSLGLLSSITRLSLLYNIGLQGTIPTEIGLLSDLESLSIAYHVNFAQSSIPTEIGSLDALQDLLIAYNNHNGEYPTEIGLLTRLEVLDFQYNPQVGGSFPLEIALLTNLEYFSLKYNLLLEGALPTEFGLLTSLNTLLLGDTGASQIPSELGKLTDLEILDLSYTIFLEGPIPTELGLLNKLNNLNLISSRLKGTIPSEVCALTDQDLRILLVDCELVLCSCCNDCSYENTNTNLPTSSPTVACTLDEMEIRLEVSTDSYPGETYWAFVEDQSKDILFSGGPYSEKYTDFVHYFCLPADSCTILAILDTEGDGFDGRGECRLFVENELVATVDMFGEQETVRFGDCPPTSAPTTSPTKELLVCDEELSSLRVDIITDEFPGETTWAVIDKENYDAALGGTEELSFILVNDNLLNAETKYTNDACLPNDTCFIFVILDEYGDGICCLSGFGSYTLTLNGEIIATGGQFRQQEIINIGPCDDNIGVVPVDPPTDQRNPCDAGFGVLSVEIKFESGVPQNNTVWSVIDSNSEITLLEGQGPSGSEVGTDAVVEEDTCVLLTSCTVFTISEFPGEDNYMDGEKFGASIAYTIYLNDDPVATGTYFGISQTLHRFGDCFPQ